MSPAFVDNEGFDWRTWGVRIRSALAVLVSLGVLVGGGWFVYTKASEAWEAYQTADDYPDPAGVEDVEVVIPQGANLTQIADILVEHDVIKARSTFRDAANDNPDSASIQPGRYAMRTQIPAATALEMLLDPQNRSVLRIQVIEGLTYFQQWDRIASQIDIEVDDLYAAATSGELEIPEWSTTGIEGYLFPETYEVGEPINAAAILARQLQQFRTVAAEIEFEARASELGLSPHEVLTVASIIEKEVNVPEYRAMVSAVIYNRIEEDMPLQMDSTVHYAVGRFDTVTTTAEEREVDSPYNTYRYRGLPPGPIASPGRASMEAAANPADSDALFFVTVNLDTGETKFAATLEEHEANVAEFQAWCQANTGRC